MAELEKASLRFEDNDTLECLFNPEKITLTRTNTFQDGSPKQDRTTVEQVFLGPAPSELEFELFFDTTATGKPVTDHTSKLLKKMEKSSRLPDAGGDLGNDRPPWVTFRWGSKLTSFKALITSATVTFEYFSSSGIPLRARVNLKLKQAMADDAFTRQNPTSGTPLPHRVHRVQRGETLDRISAQYYGDSTRWRLLASANAIEDPLALRPGALISVPDLDA